MKLRNADHVRLRLLFAKVFLPDRPQFGLQHLHPSHHAFLRVLVAKVLLDLSGAFDYVKSALGPFAEPLYWILSLSVAAYAVQQSMEVYNRTSDYETYSKEEAEAEEARLNADPEAAKKKRPTVL